MSFDFRRNFFAIAFMVWAAGLAGVRPAEAHAGDQYFECPDVGSYKATYYFMMNTQRQEFRSKILFDWDDACDGQTCEFSSSGVVWRGYFGRPTMSELRLSGYYNNNGQVLQCRVLGNRPPVIKGRPSPARE